MSYDFYLHGRAKSAEHFDQLCTALRTFDFEIVAAYAAAVVQAVPPIVVTPNPGDAVPPPPTLPPAAHHNFAPRTRQQVINLIWGVAAKLGQEGGDWASRAGIGDQLWRDQPNKDTWRAQPYAGPDIEDLPLTPDERARLIAAL